MATGVGLGQILMAPLDQPPLKTSSMVQTSSLYLLQKHSYSRFCAKNVDFSSPPLFDPKFGKLCMGVGRWHLASEEERSWANYWCNYFSEVSTYVITV